MNPLLRIDGYKTDHRSQYPDKTEYVYSNGTARKSRLPGINYQILFGLQSFLTKYLVEDFDTYFFNRDKKDVVQEYKDTLCEYLNIPTFDVSHIEDLHDLGYLPVRIKALPEGTKVPIRVPYFTIINTHPKFFWLTNQLETLISCGLWKSCTSATLAYEYRKNFDKYNAITGVEPEFAKFQGHDFSFRGMSSPECAEMSGAAHLTSFVGTDTIPAIGFLKRYYGASGLVGCSVPASEHSCMCAGGQDSEVDTFRRLICDVYPKGIVSIVSDSWDFWNVITNTTREIRPEILGRDGKVVLRPDCYDEKTEIMTATGWKYFKDLQEDDLVAQVDDNHVATYVKPLEIIKQDYKGLMVHFTDEKAKVDLCVTPNHRMVWESTNVRTKLVTTKVVDAAHSLVGYNYLKIRRSPKNQNLNKNLTWLERLKIAFQADGSFQSDHDKTINLGQISGKCSIRFTFTKTRKVARLKWICENGNFRHKLSREKSRPGQVVFYVWVDKDIILSKRLNWIPKQGDLCSQWSQEFIEEVSHWDATIRNEGQIKFDSTVEEAATIIQYVGIAAGYGVLKSFGLDLRKPHFSNVHTLHILKNPLITTVAMTKNVIHYSGKIYCVKVPTGKILVRRNRATAISGNSGDPVKILIGDNDAKSGSPEYKGAYECLWEIFGGSYTSKGFRRLDPHVGLIYGDSITLERQVAIMEGLIAKGFATDVVLGIGSYTYQYNTRDTFGNAVKSTWCQVDGIGREIFKAPKTDIGGEKFSAKGLLIVDENLMLQDQQATDDSGILQTVFENSYMFGSSTLNMIRDKLHGTEF